MLKSTQIKQFWHLGDINKYNKTWIFQDRGRPQGNINKKDNRDFSLFDLSAKNYSYSVNCQDNYSDYSNNYSYSDNSQAN